jgi:hypothetical protein
MFIKLQEKRRKQVFFSKSLMLKLFKQTAKQVTMQKVGDKNIHKKN